MGNMTKSCKEMNFLKRKSINEDKRDSKEIKEAKEVKCDDLPPVSTNQINKSKENHNVNLDQKFNEDNFNEQDFENSFQSIQTKNNILNNSSENDCYFNEDDLNYYNSKFQDEEFQKERRKSNKSKKIRWKEGEQLGMGSFGRVVLGFNKETGELMAVKQVHLIGFNTSSERVKALEIEFNLLSQLKHKNIVRYIGTTKNKEAFNIFLEFVAGGSISSLLNKYGSFKENIVRLYAKQILEGLEYLHWNNVLHRDIKGANVLVDNNGICKLADFGSAKRICGIYENEGYQSLSGTANWMAPEVIRQTGSGRFADIWSFGCTIVEMATGKPPFSEYKNPISAMFHIAKAKGPPSIPRDLSATALNFLEYCFKIVPHERYNIRKLLAHPFITGQIEVPQVLPTLDLTKEKENKILENFEHSEDKKNNDELNIADINSSMSMEMSKQIILKNSLLQSDSHIISNPTINNENPTEEKKENKESDIKILHMKLKSQEEQEGISSIERMSENKYFEDESKLKLSIGIDTIEKTEKKEEEINIPHLKLDSHEEQLSLERISVKKEKDFISEINTIEEQILNHKQSKIWKSMAQAHS